MRWPALACGDLVKARRWDEAVTSTPGYNLSATAYSQLPTGFDAIAVALLGNTLATGAMLFVLITMLGPISGAHMNPVVTLAAAATERAKQQVLRPLKYPKFGPRTQKKAPVKKP